MKHLLKLLLLAAVALPIWQPMAAQEDALLKKKSNAEVMMKESCNHQLEETQLSNVSNASATPKFKAPSLKGSQTESMSITICDGTQTNQYIPIYGNVMQNGNRTSENQFIYSAETLGLKVGDKIKSITFYSYTNVSANLANAQIRISLGKTTATTLSGLLNDVTLTQVYQGAIPTGVTTVKFTFSTPYVYQGGNLLVDIYRTQASTNQGNVSWLGVSATRGSGYYYYRSSNYSGQVSFLPKATFEVEGTVDSRNIVVKDSDFFGNITYNWTDDNGLSKTSNLNEIATTPQQIIAMLREVYTNKTIPGNLKRGFTSRGTDEPWNDCHYTGVGTVENDEPTVVSSLSNADAYHYEDSRGWNIPGDVLFKSFNNVSTYGGLGGRYEGGDLAYYAFMDSTQYRPNEEGLTLILVELKDDFDESDLYDEAGHAIYDASNLEAYISKTLKSARIISEARRTGDGFDSGTLFKIDCDKMNKFFLIAKGQVCWKNNSYYAYYVDHAASDGGPDYLRKYFCGVPAYIFYEDYEFDTWYNTLNYQYYTNGYYDYFSQPLFYHMFEQFSPNAFGEEAKDDLYALMVGDEMKSFGVVHDCASVEPVQGHGFLMYGKDSPAADCQDVRDMMFFVPDYRMMKDATRDNGSNYKFSYYNVNHQPIMGMYVIRQDEITPTTKADEYYMLQLNWRTNLDDFLPSQDQEFELLQIVVDDNGNESYVPVYYMDENGEYTDANGTPVDTPVPIVLIMEAGRIKNYPNVYVARMEQSQQVTYAIRGRDAADANGKHFLSLQISNRQSYIVPGTDPSELVLLEDATHYSRFDAQRVRNCYSNKLTMKNNSVDGINQANLTSETQLTITRQAQGATESVAIATVTFNPSSHGYTVQMANQAQDATEFPECADHSRAGYHANNGGEVEGNGSWLGTYALNTNGTIDLGTLEIFDNFVQAVPDDNSHPIGYFYNVTSNYQCENNQPTAVYLNPGVTSTGDEIWYAWTWNNATDGKWLLGTPQDGGILKFGPAKNNIIFARMDPEASNVPSFDDGTTWNRTNDLSTVGYIGKTFTLNGWDMTGYWAGDVIYDMAHSNTFRIPIYKTASQINGSFTFAEVDAETGDVPSLGVDENVKFGVGVKLGSKTEILRYDTYRWGENDPRYIIARADGDDEQDLPPTGLAMNQGDYYTISMNPDTNNETNDEVSVTSGSGTATFVDEVPGASANAAAYVYAPVVEVFSGRSEGDYNTYGGPLQSTAVGKFNTYVRTDVIKDGDNVLFDINSAKPYDQSSYTWIGEDGVEYCYYTVFLQYDKARVPSSDYELYKVRVWRQAPTAMLGEKTNLDEGDLDCHGRVGTEIGEGISSYLFEDITYGDAGTDVFGNEIPFFIGSDNSGDHSGLVDYIVGTKVIGQSGNSNVLSGTFGAKVLEGDDKLPLTFIVRSYFTKKANLTNGSKAGTIVEDKVYIVEQTITPDPITSNNVITAVKDVTAGKQISGVLYYDMAGQVVRNPQGGIFIKVTRYSDGTTSATKVLK